jgi:hypothetical protein
VTISTPIPTSPPEMTLGASKGQLILGWPVDHTGWLLQAQTNTPGTGLGANWVTLSESAATNQITIPIGAANGSVFFRLAHP